VVDGGEIGRNGRHHIAWGIQWGYQLNTTPIKIAETFLEVGFSQAVRDRIN